MSDAGQTAVLDQGDGSLNAGSLSAPAGEGFYQSITLPAGTISATLVFSDQGRKTFGPNGINVYFGTSFATATQVGATLMPASNTVFGTEMVSLGSVGPGTYTIAFAGKNPGTGDNSSYVDNVSVVATTVPEPASLGLLGLGGASLLARRRRLA